MAKYDSLDKALKNPDDVTELWLEFTDVKVITL